MQSWRGVLLITLAVGLAGCAKSSASTSEASSMAPKPRRARIEPPRMMRGDHPRIREEFDAKIEVMIDANGHPDMSTLRITGRVGGSARMALESWIQYSDFIPAKRDGVPVAAPFMMGLSQTIR